MHCKLNILLSSPKLQYLILKEKKLIRSKPAKVRISFPPQLISNFNQSLFRIACVQFIHKYLGLFLRLVSYSIYITIGNFDIQVIQNLFDQNFSLQPSSHNYISNLYLYLTPHSNLLLNLHLSRRF